MDQWNRILEAKQTYETELSGSGLHSPRHRATKRCLGRKPAFHTCLCISKEEEPDSRSEGLTEPNGNVLR